MERRKEGSLGERRRHEGQRERIRVREGLLCMGRQREGEKNGGVRGVCGGKRAGDFSAEAARGWGRLPSWPLLIPE